jgi:hypothetical protein
VAVSLCPAGGAAMTRDQRQFADLMADAYRALFALNNVTARGGSRATATAVTDGVRVYSRLVDYRQTERMSTAESSQLQNVLDLIRSSLRFFGEAV